MAQEQGADAGCAQRAAMVVAVCLAAVACGGGGSAAPGEASGPGGPDGPDSAQGIGYFKRHAGFADGSFGSQLAFSPQGDVLAVAQTSSVELFTREAGRWSSAQTLGFEGAAAPVPSFAADGSLLVGLPGADSALTDAGEVQLFTRRPGGWALAHSWHPPAPAREGGFGRSVDLSADGAVAVVAEYGDFRPGRFHVYRRSGAVWSLQQTVFPGHPQSGSRFGAHARLSADGSTIVVGAPHEDSGSGADPGDRSASQAGAAFVYGLDTAAGAWRLRAYLKPPTPTPHDWFGSATAVSGDGATVVIGERFRDVAGRASAGTAYVYRRSAGAYALAQAIEAPQPQTGGHFGGHGLALTPDGSQLAVGEIGDTSAGLGLGADPTPAGRSWAGATHRYRLQGDRFGYAQFVKASNTGQADLFGWALALSDGGQTLAVGAPAEASGSTGIGGEQADNSVLHQGAVYLY